MSAFRQAQKCPQTYLWERICYLLILVLAKSEHHKIRKKTGNPENDEGKLPFVQLGREKIVQIQDLKFSYNLALQARCWFGFEPFEGSLDLLMY